MQNKKRIRLQGYDYGSDGAYFLTICVRFRRCCLSTIQDGKVKLARAGEIVEQELLASETIRDDIFLDEYVIMPNHIHLIAIKSSSGAPTFAEQHSFPQTAGFQATLGPQRNNIPAFLRAFKSMATRKIRSETIPNFEWQKRYNDRVIRNYQELEYIRTYIKNNPVNWDDDPENLP